MITEFGDCLSEDACTAEITSVSTACDDQLAGWAYWQFKPFGENFNPISLRPEEDEGFYNQDGTLEDWKVKALARSYMQKT